MYVPKKLQQLGPGFVSSYISIKHNRARHEVKLAILKGHLLVLCNDFNESIAFNINYWLLTQTVRPYN